MSHREINGSKSEPPVKSTKPDKDQSYREEIGDNNPRIKNEIDISDKDHFISSSSHSDANVLNEDTKPVGNPIEDLSRINHKADGESHSHHDEIDQLHLQLPSIFEELSELGSDFKHRFRTRSISGSTKKVDEEPEIDWLKDWSPLQPSEWSPLQPPIICDFEMAKNHSEDDSEAAGVGISGLGLDHGHSDGVSSSGDQRQHTGPGHRPDHHYHSNRSASPQTHYTYNPILDSYPIEISCNYRYDIYNNPNNIYKCDRFNNNPTMVININQVDALSSSQPESKPKKQRISSRRPSATSTAYSTDIELDENSNFTQLDLDTDDRRKRKRIQVKTACVNCRKSCKKCSTYRPCERCTTMNLRCEDVVKKTKQPRNKRPVHHSPSPCGDRIYSDWISQETASKLSNQKKRTRDPQIVDPLHF